MNDVSWVLGLVVRNREENETKRFSVRQQLFIQTKRFVGVTINGRSHWAPEKCHRDSKEFFSIHFWTGIK